MAHWIGLAIAYALVNVAVTMWLGSLLGQRRISTRRMAAVSTAVRYAPPLVFGAYLAVSGGHWWVIVPLAAFAAWGFWMTAGLLGYAERVGGLDAMRRIHRDSEHERDRRRRKPPNAS